MKEHPILFSAPMVQALTHGHKTQTRRVLKKTPCQCDHFTPEEVCNTSPEGWQLTGHSGRWWCSCCTSNENILTCPYGKPGDHLWVKETHSLDFAAHYPCDPIWYRADDSPCTPRNIEHRDGVQGIYSPESQVFVPFKWRPAIFMRREHSRLTLKITSVRIEPLQQITRGDAMAEGCPFPNMAAGPDPRDWYRELWESLNGTGSWDANPWVWVISFRLA